MPSILLLALAPWSGSGSSGGASLAHASPPDSLYVNDVEFALDQLEEQCGHFFGLKGIDWGKVAKEFRAAAAEVKSDAEHYVLLKRLLARLRDGHADVVKLEGAEGLELPPGPAAQNTGAGMFWCRSGKRILLKNVWSTAQAAGLEAGMEVLSVDGADVDDWLERRIAEVSDWNSFSSAQHAFGYACTRGLGMPPDTRLELELKTVDGKKKKRTLTYAKASVLPVGPAFFPEGVRELEDDQKVARTAAGFGYIHLRRVPERLLEQLDEMLAELGNPPGLILDFRANGGGGCDHDAVLGRFVPEGKELARASASPLPSAGPHPYGGPIVVIVDANVISAGETASGMFKEDGRAYMIGESPTAGMSSQKTTIELPSRLFGLYVSIASNRGRFNGGRGIEGIGIAPHELVAYEAEDLASGVDTLTKRAEELLADFPADRVPYDPERYGWEPPAEEQDAGADGKSGEKKKRR